jgi:hypothetical protein
MELYFVRSETISTSEKDFIIKHEAMIIALNQLKEEGGEAAIITKKMITCNTYTLVCLYYGADTSAGDVDINNCFPEELKYEYYDAFTSARKKFNHYGKGIN